MIPKLGLDCQSLGWTPRWAGAHDFLGIGVTSFGQAGMQTIADVLASYQLPNSLMIRKTGVELTLIQQAVMAVCLKRLHSSCFP